MSYRVSKQLDLETHYTRMNVTRSNSALWPQFSSPHNTDPLYIVPVSSKNLEPQGTQRCTEAPVAAGNCRAALDLDSRPPQPAKSARSGGPGEGGCPYVDGMQQQ